MFHGRKQGVMHIDSLYQDQFTIENRLSLITFKRIFEEELFEARMNKFLIGINESLGKVLRSETTEQDFFNSIAHGFAILLGAQGALLWWYDDIYEPTYNALGAAGEKTKRIFLNAKIKETNEVIKNISDKKIIQMVKLKPKHNREMNSVENFYHYDLLVENGFQIYYNIPLITSEKINGIISFFDSDKNSYFSNFLDHELSFLGNEIHETLKHYFEYKKTIDSFKGFQAHDLLSFLRSGISSAKKLKGYETDLKKDKTSFLKNIDDIHDNIDAARVLLRFIRKEIKSNRLNVVPLLAKYKADFQRDEERVSIHALINEVLHTHEDDFKQKMKKHIYYNYQNNSPIETEITISKYVVKHVLNNIMDNIVKYCDMHNTFFITIKLEKYIGFYIEFKNIGEPLDSAVELNPDNIFKLKVRGVSPKIASEIPGQGFGLYLAKEYSRAWGGNISLQYKKINMSESEYKFIIEFPYWRVVNNK